MAPVPKAFSVVVGLDFTDADGPAFDQAARLATCVPGRGLHLVHVFHQPPSAERSRKLIENLGLYVHEKAAMTSGLLGMKVGIHLRWGRPVRKLVQLALEVEANVIVIGSHKEPHVKDSVAGSTVERLVSAASFQVLVARPGLKVPDEHDPAVEARCPVCVQTRTASGGQSWWCGRHMHAAHSLSHQHEFPMATRDSEVIPTGIVF